MENTTVGRTDCHMQLTEPRDSKDSSYRLQEFIEFAHNVTLWWCKWAIRKGINLKCFALRPILIVSDFIRPIALAPENSITIPGEITEVWGWVWIPPSMCVDILNLYKTDKELLLFSQCHMDQIEVTQK
jgi:hypothetical protein